MPEQKTLFIAVQSPATMTLYLVVHAAPAALLVCCFTTLAECDTNKEWAQVSMHVTWRHLCLLVTRMNGGNLLKMRAHKVIDGFALIGETGLVVCLHDALASPVAHSRAQVCLVALAHFAFAAESLQHEKHMRTAPLNCGACLASGFQCLASGSLTLAPQG